MGVGENKIEWESERLAQLAGIALQDWPPGALYVVATPIGNLADITLRALWLLAHADAIAAEDTRVSRNLLARYEIATPPHGVFAAHTHNERAASARVIELLAGGARIALVTDAGTPAISDPGARLVRMVRDAGYRVIPIPGASSALAALSAAGFAGTEFGFLGFLPTGAKNRAQLLADFAARGEAFVFFEAPHRVLATLGELGAVLDPQRRVLIARELTKVHETLSVMVAGEIAPWSETHEPRGEYVVAVDGAEEASSKEIDTQTQRWLYALADELPASRAAAVAAKATGLSRDLLFTALSARKRER